MGKKSNFSVCDCSQIGFYLSAPSGNKMSELWFLSLRRLSFWDDGSSRQ